MDTDPRGDEVVQATELTDEDLIELLENHEAGVADLLEAHRLAEAAYFPAAAASAPMTTYTTVASSNTIPR